MSASARPAPAPAVLDRIRDAVGPKGVVEGGDREPHLVEWRGTWRGETPLVVAPATTEEVAAVVKICAAEGVAITPQGGNTGLVGGQIPFGAEVLLSLKRLARIRDVSPLDNTMTLEAGVTLAAAQAAAQEADRLFPLSLGSEGTCQIGGVISTNAGGVHVLRYGNTRELVLGIEAVTASGEIWNGLRRLRKDNTGYDLKQLFIGGEGTLGIVTAATLRLFPRPQETAVAFAGIGAPDDRGQGIAHKTRLGEQDRLVDRRVGDDPHLARALQGARQGLAVRMLQPVAQPDDVGVRQAELLGGLAARPMVDRPGARHQSLQARPGI